MKKTIVQLVIFLVFGLVISSCDITTEERTEVPHKNGNEEVKIAKNVSNDPDILLLMHSRQGIRIEYNVNKQELELWISPLAGESINYKVRNFSNRDDHTRLFDKIHFPGLKPEDYKSVDYDPFHSVVNFKEQKLHIASLFDKPVVMVWMEQPGIIDMKTDKADQVWDRKKQMFTVLHPDRDMELNFVAALQDTNSYFQHQLQIDKGRSTYARVHMAANSPMFIAGNDKEDGIPYKMPIWLQTSLEDHMAQTEKQVNKIAKMGRILVKNDDELQKLLDVNKKAYISMQDESGAVRAAIKRIYYLIWVRDGGMSSPFFGYAGWTETLEKWTRFQMANPTVVTNEEPTGRFFGQLVNGKITKWEEDGPFYAIWSAYTHWTQTGSKEFVDWKPLALMMESMTWLEKYCYDTEMKAFGRYHYCETPLTDSRGNGWDNAVGNPTQKSDTKFEEQNIVRSYDIYINLLAYTSYMMLADMSYAPKSDEYRMKANNLVPFIEKLCKGEELPDYGVLETKEGEKIIAGPYGMDETDYYWALTLPLYYPDCVHLQPIREKLFEDMMAKPERRFLAAWFSLLASMDIEYHDQDTMMTAVHYAAKQSYDAGIYLPMAYTMIEMTDVPDGDMYHYIRPQGFTIGSWFGAMANLAVKRYPHGVAIRASGYIEGIEDYHYRDAVIDIKFTGDGSINKIILNGSDLTNSWQIPEELLKEDKNELIVVKSTDAVHENVLIGSTVQLKEVKETETSLVYVLNAFGTNELTFKNFSKKVSLFDAYNQPVEFKTQKQGDYTKITFSGKNFHRLVVE